MRTIYLDCGMGAAGDMLTAALIEIAGNRSDVVEALNSIGIPGVEYSAEDSVKCGIKGTHVNVRVNGEGEAAGEDVHSHSHSHPDEHSHEHEHDHGHTHEHIHEHEHEHGHTHEHSHEHEHEHSHEHAHEHEHEHDHAHNHSHNHSHNGLNEVRDIIDGLNVSNEVKTAAYNVYRLIAEAESAAHNEPVDKVHFHEVGSMDAIADVVACCYLMKSINPDRIVVSPVNVGYGKVRCAHGILPVPAPATAHILRGVPTYAGIIEGELCTPTGAALIKYWADEYGQMPPMSVARIGYGMGTKDFEAANCVRAHAGESFESSPTEKKAASCNAAEDELSDTVIKLECNIDDMTAESYAFALETILDNGALDAFTTQVIMKKGRPGFMLTVLCREEDRERMIELIFRHTATIGVREERIRRYVLRRQKSTISTEFGEVGVKLSSGYGAKRIKFEHEDLARIARERGISIDEVKKGL